MYLPYLRGRQFELLALRELLKESLLGDNILPIVEPIKLTPTLLSTAELFVDTGHPVSIVHNPKVGSFSKELANLSDDDSLRQRYEEIVSSQLVITSHIINQDSRDELLSAHGSGTLETNQLILITDDKKALDGYPREFTDSPPLYNLMPDESMFRRKIRKRKVLFEDRFERQMRNIDYLGVEDELYSDAHLFYRDDGFVGFSDYSIVGSKYTESGFAPFAVAIHIVYFDSEDNLRVRHFVSDSNDDINDPARKFYEAVEKLVVWNAQMGLHSRALEIFEEHYDNGTYPGLGTVKKLSIMHHLELMSTFLDGVGLP